MKRIMIVHQYIWYLVYGYGQRQVVPADEVELPTAVHSTEAESSGDMMSSDKQVGHMICHHSVGGMGLSVSKSCDLCPNQYLGIK